MIQQSILMTAHLQFQCFPITASTVSRLWKRKKKVIIINSISPSLISVSHPTAVLSLSVARKGKSTQTHQCTYTHRWRCIVSSFPGYVWHDLKRVWGKGFIIGIIPVGLTLNLKTQTFSTSHETERPTFIYTHNCTSMTPAVQSHNGTNSGSCTTHGHVYLCCVKINMRHQPED